MLSKRLCCLLPFSCFVLRRAHWEESRLFVRGIVLATAQRKWTSDLAWELVIHRHPQEKEASQAVAPTRTRVKFYMRSRSPKKTPHAFSLHNVFAHVTHTQR